MDRRDFHQQLAWLLGISVVNPAAALDLGHALGAAQSLGKAATLSDADLKQYFDQISADYDRRNPVASATDPYGARLIQLTRGLDRYDGLTLNFKVYRVRDVNAFAMANGTVRVFAGLMDMMSDDEVRYVIGHEIGHIKAGHSKARMKAALTTDAARHAIAAADGRAAQLASGELGALFQKVVLAQHSQSNENEADDYAWGFLKKNHYQTAAAASALDKLAKLGGGGGGWLSTHPAPAERARRMRAKA